MADDGASGSSIPIYVSYSTLGTFLDRLRDMKVIPSRLDSSLWRDKFSGAVGSQLMGGLRFLKLVEGDRPTESLEALAFAEPDRRKDLLRIILREAYGPELVDGLPRMTPRMLEEKLSQLGTTDATHRKAASFFINAAKALDLDVPPNIAKRARNKAATGRSRKNGAKTAMPTTTKGQVARREAEDTKPPAHTPPEGSSRVIPLKGGGRVTVVIDVELVGLRGSDRQFVFDLIDKLDEYEAFETRAPSEPPSQMP